MLAIAVVLVILAVHNPFNTRLLGPNCWL